ncbi:uncharacterized protein VTP21DRAFT_5902 [Calcarisporiella thermophila]|uniref:uncharacterized protein n=1 Tax=Calcarisporiella thermophila TaxID=911321 RepID=UPI00374479AC
MRANLFVFLSACIAFVGYTVGYTVLSDENLKKLADLSQPSRLAVDGEFLKPLLVPRVSGTEGNERVRQFITTMFHNLNWEVDNDTFTAHTPLGEKSFTNIIVTKQPDAPRRLVLAAHYDSKYFPDTDVEFIGATDSAVPCALLIDLAHSLDSFLNQSSNTTLQIIFFDGEEAFDKWSETDSIYGSKHLAEKWDQSYIIRTDTPFMPATSKLDGIEVFILLDLIGAANSRIPNYFPTTSWLFNNFANLEKRLWSLPVLEDAGEGGHNEESYFSVDSVYSSLGGFIGDDHLPFLQRGVPIVHLIPYPFPSVWHTKEDNATAIDPPTVANWAIILRTFVAEYLDLFKTK